MFSLCAFMGFHPTVIWLRGQGFYIFELRQTDQYIHQTATADNLSLAVVDHCTGQIALLVPLQHLPQSTQDN